MRFLFVFLFVFLGFFFRLVFFRGVSGEDGNGTEGKHGGEQGCEQLFHYVSFAGVSINKKFVLPLWSMTITDGKQG